MSVVLAHELLHAQWARLSKGEREAISTPLKQTEREIADRAFKERMAQYERTEPGEETNELHSILGSEHSALPPVLQAHYRQVFSGREGVLLAHEAFRGAFERREKALERELAAIETQKASLRALDARMTALKRMGRIAEYNALVSRQNQAVQQVNADIVRYRKGVEEYNALARTLDSHVISDEANSSI